MTDGVDPRRVAAPVLDRLYRGAESCDLDRLRTVFRPDAFVFTTTAGGVLTSADEVIADLQHWFAMIAARAATLRLRSDGLRVGASASRRGLWVFDEVVAEVVRNGKVLCSEPIRLTALLALHEDWRIAAAYWSLPFRTQADQDATKKTGGLEPGRTLDEAIADEAAPLVAALQAALREPRLLPGLYSTGDDHVTIGSVVGEVFVGGAGRAAWDEFVQHVDAFSPRGPMRAALAATDIGWLAANIDIGRPATPYRFFYIWAHEETGWKIVVSHDAVSRNPLAAGSLARRPD